MTTIDPYRSTGRTTRQIETAPKNAVFVWCNDRIDYAKTLARELGRADLKVVPPSWLQTDAIRGIRRGIVVDHAAVLTSRQRAEFDIYASRIRIEADSDGGECD
jgi:hypothetical protein